MADEEHTPPTAEKKGMSRNLIIGIVVVLLLLFGLGGFYVLSNRNAETEDGGYVEEELPKISPEEIGLEILPSSDKKYIQFKLTKLEGIKHIEWEFTYDADATETGDGEGSGGRITQGFGGEADIDDSESEFVSERRELGTCSTGGKCRFDSGIETVEIIIKVEKDGKVYQAEDSISL